MILHSTFYTVPVAYTYSVIDDILCVFEWTWYCFSSMVLLNLVCGCVCTALSFGCVFFYFITFSEHPHPCMHACKHTHTHTHTHTYARTHAHTHTQQQQQRQQQRKGKTNRITNKTTTAFRPDTTLFPIKSRSLFVSIYTPAPSLTWPAVAPPLIDDFRK